MGEHCSGVRWLQVGVILASSLAAVTATGVTTPLPLAFFFDWNDPQVSPVPIPITEQCETIKIKWSRQSATGPNPVAPYYLQVFTSNSTVPFTVQAGITQEFDWAVPFAPGTQYQICMYDTNGNTGGCQAMYTVIPSSNPNLPAGCTNLTKVPQLDVDPKDHTGPLSRFGFTDQCTDISVTPKGGVAPYTLTVAPPLHPPYNITSNDMSPINWTLSLNWAMPFFIGLSDSNGSMWSFGPLHAGGGGTTGCLAGNVTTSSHHQIGVPVAIGVTFLMLIFGVLSGVGGTYAFTAYKRKNAGSFVKLHEGGSSQEATDNESLPRPFPAPDEEAALRNPANNQVYVLHHDANMAPVTIIHEGNMNVVELPPRYPVSRPQSEILPNTQAATPISRSSSYNSTSPARVTDSERHYNPSGPWQVRQPAASVRKPSDPGPP